MPCCLGRKVACGSYLRVQQASFATYLRTVLHVGGDRHRVLGAAALPADIFRPLAIVSQPLDASDDVGDVVVAHLVHVSVQMCGRH